MMPARQAAQTAEDARLVGLQRQDEAFQAEQRRIAAAARGGRAGARPGRSRTQRRQAELNAQTRRPRAQRGGRGAREGASADAGASAGRRRARAGRGRARRAPRPRPRAQRRPRRRCATREAEARAGARRRGAVRAREGRAARAPAPAAQRDPRDARDGARPDRQPVRRAVRHRAGDARSRARARSWRASRGFSSAHPDLKLEIEGHTDSVGSDELQPGALGAPRRVGARAIWCRSASRRRPSRRRASARAARWPPTTPPRAVSRTAASSWSCRARPSARTDATAQQSHGDVHAGHACFGSTSAALLAALCPALASAQNCTTDARQVVNAIYRQVLERNPNGERGERVGDPVEQRPDDGARAGADMARRRPNTGSAS